MNIIEQSIELVEEVDGEAILWKIEAACRVCYKSEGKNSEHDTKKRDALIRSAVKRGHTSVLEHASISFRVITNRGVSHEWVRHRIGCSYSQESTRYCNYGHADGITVIWPLHLGPMPALAYGEWGPRVQHWIQGMKSAERYYLEDLKLYDGKPEESREFLNNALKTEFITTMNPVSIRHFLTLRCTERAHYQIRALALQALAILKDKGLGILFEDIAERHLTE